MEALQIVDRRTCATETTDMYIQYIHEYCRVLRRYWSATADRGFVRARTFTEKYTAFPENNPADRA